MVRRVPTLLLALLLLATAPAAAHARPPRAHAAIVGGTPAPVAGAMAVVLAPDAQCSGTVVSSTTVLTAAHCALSHADGSVLAPGALRVVVGATALSAAQPSQVATVARVGVDPDYNGTTSAHDAALLQIAGTIGGTPQALGGAADVAAGLLGAATPTAISGWGATEVGSSMASDTLRTGRLVVQTASYCADHAALMGRTFAPTLQVCALDPDGANATCRGDSGGPLLAARADGTPVQIGITSWGSAACLPSQPSYFTRTDVLADWIATWLAAPPPAPQDTTPATPPAGPTTPAAPATPVVSPPVRAASNPLVGGVTYALRATRDRYVAATLATDDTHLLRLRVRTRLTCGRGGATSDHTWHAATSTPWRIAPGHVLKLTLHAPATARWFAERDVVTLRRSANGNRLTATVSASRRSRAGRPGLCRTTTAPATLAPRATTGAR